MPISAMSNIKKWTEEEYLAFERASETKHEFYQGEMLAMVGASEEHNLITLNTAIYLHGQLRRPPCRIYTNDMRVKMSAVQHYAYPDVVVVCGTPLFEKKGVVTLLNPLLIIEVLSKSTEAYDRGRKFHDYATLDSLQEYVLISQDSPRIERYLRQPDNQWLLASAVGLDASLELTSIQCTLTLANVYEQVEFKTEGTEDSADSKSDI